MSTSDSQAGLPPTACPRCGCRLDAADQSNGGTARPRPGDFSVCWGCGQVLVFTEACGLRAAVTADLVEADPATRAELARVSHAIRRLINDLWKN